MTDPGRPQLAVGAIVLRDDHLLLVKRGGPPDSGRWTLPGGRVERGELLAEAVVRELREETGIVGVCSDRVGIAELLPGNDATDGHYVVVDFLVTLLDPHQEPTAATDAVDARWVPTWDVAEMDLTPGLAEFLSAHDLIDTIA
ncbi:MAG: NUDIX domain-containing protein [Microthrixaceae bacterium]|nr:NUDIX domain-containing protein [Microthrixaceae bacterium]